MLDILCDVIHDVIGMFSLTNLIDWEIGEFQKRLASVIEQRNEMVHFFMQHPI